MTRKKTSSLQRVAGNTVAILVRTISGLVLAACGRATARHEVPSVGRAQELNLPRPYTAGGIASLRTISGLVLAACGRATATNNKASVGRGIWRGWGLAAIIPFGNNETQIIKNLEFPLPIPLNWLLYTCSETCNPMSGCPLNTIPSAEIGGIPTILCVSEQQPGTYIAGGRVSPVGDKDDANGAGMGIGEIGGIATMAIISRVFRLDFSAPAAHDSVSGGCNA